MILDSKPQDQSTFHGPRPNSQSFSDVITPETSQGAQQTSRRAFGRRAQRSPPRSQLSKAHSKLPDAHLAAADNVRGRAANFPRRTANFPMRVWPPGTTFAAAQPTFQGDSNKKSAREGARSGSRGDQVSMLESCHRFTIFYTFPQSLIHFHNLLDIQCCWPDLRDV